MYPEEIEDVAVVFRQVVDQTFCGGFDDVDLLTGAFPGQIRRTRAALDKRGPG